ncbi:hypothetical protein [Microbacterium allomyrinae]|uniref:Uncharacterized protein n=1 Tax=Microbacterium allomyrinae TaxID=2830666 RepID=A0A9X1S1T9_9MICO|nr:hypothetical protein [Microbacterium allomyrinae]MCC2030642.1 hypothetical protein [Microbacterium allomyrinae]
MPEEAFRKRKADAVAKAEALVARGGERLETAMREYDAEVARHEERGDGFFSAAYVFARKEAVLARKSYDARVSRLSTARAELAAPVMPLPAAVAS